MSTYKSIKIILTAILMGNSFLQAQEVLGPNAPSTYIPLIKAKKTNPAIQNADDMMQQNAVVVHGDSFFSNTQMSDLSTTASSRGNNVALSNSTASPQLIQNGLSRIKGYRPPPTLPTGPDRIDNVEWYAADVNGMDQEMVIEGQFSSASDFTLECPGYLNPITPTIIETAKDPTNMVYTDIYLLIPGDFVAHQCTIAENPPPPWVLFAANQSIPPFPFTLPVLACDGYELPCYGNVVATYNSKASDGSPISVQIRQGIDNNYLFNSNDIQSIETFLSSLPQDELKNIHFIQSGTGSTADPLYRSVAGGVILGLPVNTFSIPNFAAPWEPPITYYLPRTSMPFQSAGNLAYVIGDQVYKSLSSFDQQLWDTLSNSSDYEGSFASLYSQWLTTSGSILNQAILGDEGSNGSSAQLNMALAMAAQFVDPSSNSIKEYLFENDATGNITPVEKNVQVYLKNNVLTIGSNQFGINPVTDQIVSINPGSPAKIDLTTPVQIPPQIVSIMQIQFVKQLSQSTNK